MPELKLILTDEQIKKKVMSLSERLSKDYRMKTPVFIGVLKGSFIFLSDLIRCMSVPLWVDFLRVSSYGRSMVSSGSVHVLQPKTFEIKGKDVVLVEDIVDTGTTASFLLDQLERHRPTSLKLCAFIDKRERRKTSVCVDYACHRVEEGFLVGYGLDYAEKYRQLAGVYQLNFSD